MFSLPVLEHQLVMYVTSEGRDTFSNAFDLSSVPVVTREQADAEDRTKKLNTAMPTLKAPSTGPGKKPGAAESRSGADSAAASAAAATQKYATELQKIPEIAAYGGVLKSSAVTPLTESETEYVVSAVKHVFKDAVVLQYDIKNTLPEVVLTDVSMVVTPSDDEAGLEEDFIIPVPKLVPDTPGTAYVAFKKTEDAGTFAATSFTNVLKFTTKEVDPATGEPEEGGYDDEYEVEDVELTGADYVVPAFAGSFENVWEQAGSGEGEEASETMQLANMKSISGMILLLFQPMNHSPLLSPRRIPISKDTLFLVLLLPFFPVQNSNSKLTSQTPRRNRSPHQNAFSPTPRRNGRHPLNLNAHAQALRQDGHGRPRCRNCAHGVPREGGRHHEDHGQGGGGGRCCFGCGER